MRKKEIVESYIIMDLIHGNFWDGNFFISSERRPKFFESELDAENEIKSGRLKDFRGIMCVKKVYPNI